MDITSTLQEAKAAMAEHRPALAFYLYNAVRGYKERNGLSADAGELHQAGVCAIEAARPQEGDFESALALLSEAEYLASRRTSTPLLLSAIRCDLALALHLTGHQAEAETKLDQAIHALRTSYLRYRSPHLSRQFGIARHMSMRISETPLTRTTRDDWAQALQLLRAGQREDKGCALRAALSYYALAERKRGSWLRAMFIALRAVLSALRWRDWRHISQSLTILVADNKD